MTAGFEAKIDIFGETQQVLDIKEYLCQNEQIFQNLVCILPLYMENVKYLSNLQGQMKTKLLQMGILYENVPEFGDISEVFKICANIFENQSKYIDYLYKGLGLILSDFCSNQLDIVTNSMKPFLPKVAKTEK